MKTEFSSLLDFLNQNFDDVGEDANIQKVLDENIKGYLVNFIKSLVSYYKQSVARISLLTTFPFHEISFSINFDTVSDLELSEELREKVSLFVIYNNVQLIDHYFSDDELIFEQLSILLKKIKKSTVPSKLKTSVIEKINFLKHKWVLRQYYYSLDDESLNNRAYIVDGEVVEYFGEEEFVTQNEKLKEWGRYLENHYGLARHSTNNILKDIDVLKNKKLENLKLIEIHALIKYYKDLNSNKSELRAICDYLISKVSTLRDLYEIQIHKKAVIYALNNYFSLLIDEDDINKIEEVHSEIEVYQSKFNITNYFADKKYIAYILAKIDNAYNERKILDNLEKESIKLSKLETTIKRCKKRLNWAFKHHTLIFQMGYVDSLVPTQSTSIPGLFYASSFALPIPERINKTEFKHIELKFEKLILLTNSLASLKLEFNEVKNLQENLTNTQEELKNNDFKSIEIIGLFTAIVTFVIASIPALQFIDSFEKAFYFYIVLGGTLSTMILVILLMRKGSNALAQNWISILCLVLIVVCAIVFFRLV